MKKVTALVLAALCGAATFGSSWASDALDSLELAVEVLDGGEVLRIEIAGIADELIDAIEDASDDDEASLELPEAVLTIVPAEGEALVVVMRWDQSTSTLATEVDALHAPLLLSAILKWPDREAEAIPSDGVQEFPTP